MRINTKKKENIHKNKELLHQCCTKQKKKCHNSLSYSTLL